MKIYKIILTILACAVFTACGDKLAEMNENPNASLSAGNGEETLTSGMGYYGIALEAYFNEYDALMAQYVAGGPGVALLDAERYFVEPLDFNTEWSFSYLQALSDLSYTVANGTEPLSAIADILSVAIFQNLVDHFGDVPYTEALVGSPELGGILNPTYDDDAAIYSDLVTRLDAAIATLAVTTVAVGPEDVMYNGDLTAWTKYANSLKLRILMRQSIVDASVGPQVIDLIANGTFIETAGDMAIIPFAGGATQNWNPFYARREQGIGQFYCLSKSLADKYVDLNDPRDAVMFDVAGGPGTIVGLPQGGINDFLSSARDDFSYPSSVAYAPDNDVILMSHWETMFYRCEADMRFGTADDETAMFNAAVTAHFNYIGASGAAAYLSTDAVWNAASPLQSKSDILGTQKWLASAGLQESEGWIEARRFDVAPTNIFTNASTGIWTTPSNSVLGNAVFPSARIYPQTELSFNEANVPADNSLTKKVFWDN